MKYEECRAALRALVAEYGVDCVKGVVGEVLPVGAFSDSETDYDAANRRGDLYECIVALVRQHGMADVDFIVPVVREDLSK